MEFVSDRVRNPLGLSPPCERFVAGYGDLTAAFHVIGDHPGRHGGIDTGVPFTGQPWSDRFFECLADGGLLASDPHDGDQPNLVNTFLSYLHGCVTPTDEPSEEAYSKMEAYFDAEVRAITADVLVPVGRRPTAHVLHTYTARSPDLADDMSALHGRELSGAGWLVVPCREPDEWTSPDEARLAETLRELRTRGFQQRADLGRFLPGDDPYFVR